LAELLSRSLAQMARRVARRAVQAQRARVVVAVEPREQLQPQELEPQLLLVLQV